MSIFQLLMLFLVWKLFGNPLHQPFLLNTHKVCIYQVIMHIWRCELSFWRWFIYTATPL